MNNMVIFPYDETVKKVLQYITSKSFSIKGIVSPKGWGYYGQTVVVDDEIININYDFEQIEAEFNSICLVNSYFELDFDKYVLPIILQCEKNNWNLIIYRNLSIYQLQVIQSHISKDKLHIKYEFNEEINMGEEIYDINIPIVFIVDMLAKLKSQDAQLEIYKELEKEGIQLS